MVSIFKKKVVEEQRDIGGEPLMVLRGLEKEEVSLWKRSEICWL